MGNLSWIQETYSPSIVPHPSCSKTKRYASVGIFESDTDFDGLRDRPFPKLTEKKTITRSGFEAAHSDLQRLCSEYVPEVGCNRKSTLKKKNIWTLVLVMVEIPYFDLLTEIRKKTTSPVCTFSQVFSPSLCPPRSLDKLFQGFESFSCVFLGFGIVLHCFCCFR